MTADNTWRYRDTSWTERGDFVGCDVEATDGSIGNVDSATNDTSGSYVVVDTGFWIFGKKRLIPAGAITSADHDARTVHLSMTKDQVKDAPDYDADDWNDASRSTHQEYYSKYSAY